MSPSGNAEGSRAGNPAVLAAPIRAPSSRSSCGLASARRSSARVRARRRSPWPSPPTTACARRCCSTNGRRASSPSGWRATSASRGGAARDVGHGRRELRAGRGRGVAGARAAGRPDRRPAAGAAGPRRAADHRPDPAVRRAREVVRRSCRCRTTHPRRWPTSGPSAGRAVAAALAGAGRAGPPQRPVPGAADPVGPLGRMAGAGATRPSRRRHRGPRASCRGRDAARGADRGRAEHGLIVAGPMGRPGASAARRRRWPAQPAYPILADPLSGLRAGPHDRAHVLARGDQLVRPGPGSTPTSRHSSSASGPCRPRSRSPTCWRAAPELYVVDGDGGWREAADLPATFLHADAASTAPTSPTALARGRDTRPTRLAREWLRRRAAADDRDDASWLADLDEPFEGGAVRTTSPTRSPMGPSCGPATRMPVRDLDGWLPSTDRASRVHGQPRRERHRWRRLDGARVARRWPGAVVLVVGDVSLPARPDGARDRPAHGVALTVVLIKNDGGGIFSFLPQAPSTRRSGCRSTTSSCSGRRTAWTIGPFVEAAGHQHCASSTTGGARRRRWAGLGRAGLQVVELRDGAGTERGAASGRRGRGQRALGAIWPAAEVAREPDRGRPDVVRGPRSRPGSGSCSCSTASRVAPRTGSRSSRPSRGPAIDRWSSTCSATAGRETRIDPARHAVERQAEASP